MVSTNPRRSYTQSFDTLSELFQVAVETYLVLHETRRVVLNAELAERVGGQVGEVWFCVNGVRWTEPGGRSICMIESYIPPRFEHLLDALEHHDGPFFSLLEQHEDGPIRQVVQEIRAVAMPSRVSRHLGMRPDAIALQLLRRYITSEGVMIASFNWHPADQFTYTMHIDRSEGL